MSKSSKVLIAGLTCVACVCAVVLASRLPTTTAGHGSKIAHVVAAAPKPVPEPAPKPVAASAPLAFVISGPAFRVQARVCNMPNIRPLDPPGEQHHTVCWVDQGFGVAPASNAAGTSYLLGHAWAEDSLEVLNPLSIYAMNHLDMSRPVSQSGVPTYPVSSLHGYTITLTTARGTLVYDVADAYAVAKEQAAELPALMKTSTPNRVVVITCGVHDGQDVDVNVIVDAYLRSYSAA